MTVNGKSDVPNYSVLAQTREDTRTSENEVCHLSLMLRPSYVHIRLDPIYGQDVDDETGQSRSPLAVRQREIVKALRRALAQVPDTQPIFALLCDCALNDDSSIKRPEAAPEASPSASPSALPSVSASPSASEALPLTFMKGLVTECYVEILEWLHSNRWQRSGLLPKVCVRPVLSDGERRTTGENGGGGVVRKNGRLVNFCWPNGVFEKFEGEGLIDYRSICSEYGRAGSTNTAEGAGGKTASDGSNHGSTFSNVAFGGSLDGIHCGHMLVLTFLLLELIYSTPVSCSTTPSHTVTSLSHTLPSLSHTETESGQAMNPNPKTSCVNKILYIGLSTDDVLARKPLKEFSGDYNERSGALINALESILSTLGYSRPSSSRNANISDTPTCTSSCTHSQPLVYEKLSLGDSLGGSAVENLAIHITECGIDGVGIAGVLANLDALLVTDETYGGAQRVNAFRVEKGLKPLLIIRTPVLYRVLRRRSSLSLDREALALLTTSLPEEKVEDSKKVASPPIDRKWSSSDERSEILTLLKLVAEGNNAESEGASFFEATSSASNDAYACPLGSETSTLRYIVGPFLNAYAVLQKDREITARTLSAALPPFVVDFLAKHRRNFIRYG